MLADGGQRGGDDGLVERAEEHRQHDAEDDRADFLVAELRDEVVVKFLKFPLRGGRARGFARRRRRRAFAAAGGARASRGGMA